MIRLGRAARRSGAGLLLAGVAVASCTVGSDVVEVSSNRETAPPVSTLSPMSVDGSTPIVAPDPTGLPSVGEMDPAVVAGELDNGLRYLIRANDNPGRRVEMRLVIDAGSALEDRDQAGVAHFLEHMLFNGTEQFPENELIAVLRSFGAGFGADINAYTNYDETVYSLTMPTDDDVVDTGLDVLEQWLSAATIDQDQVEAERGIVLDEWRGSEASSTGRIFNGLEELFLSGTAYEGRDLIGDEPSITSMNTEPLRRFYDDWYRPDNAALVVVGDISAAEIEEGLIDRFGPLGDRGTSPERPELLVEPSSDAEVVIVSDPDVAEGFAQVTLPSTPPTGDVSAEAAIQEQILDALAFDIVATRLANDALRGEAPFDDARVDSSGFVRGLDAPEIVVSADGDALEASTQAVFDEYERVRRYGFTQAEVDRAVASVRRASETAFDGRDSRQDASFAEEYVRHVLIGEPIPTADDQYALVEVVLDRATPETVAYGLVDRLDSVAPHVMVVVPDREADALPAADVFLDQAADTRSRNLAPRPDAPGIDGDLMVAPDPVDVVSIEALSDGTDVSFVAPRVLEFDNGVRVSLNTTNIVDGQVDMVARSPGGLDVLADVDVPAAIATGPVVGRSGVATYDPVALDAFLADKDVNVQLGVDNFTEAMSATASSSDLEVLLQLIHLYMTQPRVDDVALEQYLDDELPYAADPTIDPGYAEFRSLLDARYDDPRYLLPTVDTLNAVTSEDIGRIVRDRFGDASDFSFSFSGDFDLDEATDLARRYLGTLPASGRSESVDYLEPPPPAGVVAEQTTAGQGEQAARVSFLFTAPASAERVDDVTAAVVQELITSRLTDTIREDLGDSYSPFAVVEVGAGAEPFVQTYISNTTGTELVVEVATAVDAQLDDLRSNGPTDTEFAAATEAVRQQLELFSNRQINVEVLDLFTDPGGTMSFDDFLSQAALIDDIDAADVQSALAAWLPADRFIQVRVLPR